MLTELTLIANRGIVVDPNKISQNANSLGSDRAWIAGPVNEERISQAEERLGVVFPDIYRAFISSFGAIVFGGYELAGLTPNEVNEAPIFSDVVFLSENNIYPPYSDAVRQYVYLSSDGLGTDFLLDCLDKSQIRVVARGPGHDDICVAQNLSAFFEELQSDGFAATLNSIG